MILHAPSSRRRKGTEHVLAACEGLDADLVLVEGLDHREAFERYREADIVVDQLNAGWYGLFAIECMALGKPVVTFLHDEAVRRTEQELGVTVPIVSATKDDLRASSHSSPTPPSAAASGGLARLREQVHDLERVADRLLALYSRCETTDPRPSGRWRFERSGASTSSAAPTVRDPWAWRATRHLVWSSTRGTSRGRAYYLARTARSTRSGGTSSTARFMPVELRLGGGARKHSAIYGLGGLVSRILAVLLLPLYTRYLSPSDYGKVETLIALTTVIGIVLRMGIHSAFFRFYFDSPEPEHRRLVLRTSFWFTMAMATAGLLAGLLLSGTIADLLFGSADDSELVMARFVGLWAGMNYEQLTSLFRVEERSVAFVSASLANILLTIGATLLLVVALDQGPIGVIVGNFIGTLLVYAALVGYRREQLGLQFDRGLLREMNRFGVPLVPTALFLWVTNFSDRLFLVRLADTTRSASTPSAYGSPRRWCCS